MSKLIHRLAKLEESQKSNKLALLLIQPGETEVEAYVNRFPEPPRPKSVLYMTRLDMLL